MLADDHRRTSTIVAIEPVITLLSAVRRVSAAVRGVPGVKDLLVRMLAQRVDRLSAHLIDALYLPADGRVLRTLVDLCGQYADRGPSRSTFRSPRSTWPSCRAPRGRPRTGTCAGWSRRGWSGLSAGTSPWSTSPRFERSVDHEGVDHRATPGHLSASSRVDGAPFRGCSVEGRSVASDGPADPTGRRRRSWLAALAAAVLVAAGASGIVLLTRHTGAGTDPVAQVTVTATPSVSPTSGGTAAPGVVVLGPTEQPRSAIPWGQVGPGWSAASWSSSTEATSATLFLLSPTGSRYVIGDDAECRRLRHHVRRSPSSHCRPRADVGTGVGRRRRDVTHDRPRPARRRDLHPTGRQGPAHHRPSAARTRTQRRALDGSVQVTFPADTGIASMTPDGLSLVAGTTSGLAVYGNATGTLVRTLPAPAGYGSCSVVSWWPDGRALTRCALGGNGVANLWLYPVDGGAPTDAHRRDGRLGHPLRLPGRLAGQHRDAGPGGGRLRRRTARHADLADQLEPARPSPSPASRATRIRSRTPSRWWATSPTSSSRRRSAAARQSRALVVHDVVTGMTGVIMGPGVDDGTVGPVAVIDPGR